MAQSPPPLHGSRRPQRFRSYHSSASQSMEVPRLSLDAISLARALAAAAADSLAQLRARPRVETAVKCSGGVAAALLALKFAKSLRAACAVGLLAGVFAHSLYADVLRKKPAPALTAPPATSAPAAAMAPRRRESRAASRHRDSVSISNDDVDEADVEEENVAARYVEAETAKPRGETATRARFK